MYKQKKSTFQGEFDGNILYGWFLKAQSYWTRLFPCVNMSCHSHGCRLIIHMPGYFCGCSMTHLRPHLFMESICSDIHNGLY